MFFQLFLGDVKALDDLVRRDDGVVSFAAGGEEIGEQRLQDGEALRHDGPGGALTYRLGARWRSGGGELRGCLLVPVADCAQCLGDLAPELIRLDRDRPTVLPENPGRELWEGGVPRDEDAVLQLAGVAERTLDPPGRVS